MKSLFEHIEYLKQKPHDTRRQIAFATAFGASALVALVWFVGVVSTGTFAIQGSSFAESTGQQPSLATGPQSSHTDLLGAASAADAASNSANAPAHIEIISTATSSTLSGKSGGPQAEQTVIPF